MTAPVQLAALQQWLLATIADPAPIDAATVCNRISASRQQAPEQRLSVYQQAYFARLLDVLRELFPCTRFAVGDETFDDLATGYIVQHPPRSYTLARLADRLSDYLDQTRPSDGDWALFVVELTRLEQAIDRIFDGPGPEGLPPFDLPPAASLSLQLKLVPGCELFTFRFPVSTFYSDWKAGREPRWPTPQAQHVALWRRDYVVRRWELSAVQAKLLAAIQEGAALGAALHIAGAAAGMRDDADVDQLAADVRRWFTQWAAAGLFAAV